jgi:hypothetical protein
MRLVGKLYKGTTILKEELVEVGDDAGTYQDRLEQCIIEVCRRLSIDVPLWLGKNTREYAAYRRTSFNADQFFNPVCFDRFEIRTI